MRIAHFPSLVFCALAATASAQEQLIPPGAHAVKVLRHGDVVAATWRAPHETAGVEVPWYALSLDGGATWGRPRSTSYEILLRYAEFDPLAGGAPPVPADLSARPEHELWIVQYVAKGVEPWREEIRALGAVDHRHLANHANVWRMDAATAAAVAELPFVRWVGPFHPAYKLENELLAQFHAGALETRRYRIEVGAWGPSEKYLVAERIAALGGRVEERIDEGWIIGATLAPAQVMELVHLSEVHGIERWGDPETDMNNARAVLGANYVETAGGYDGTGVRAEVMDGGLDTVHPDWGLPPILHGSVGSDSHGTCTYGINFSIGASNVNARGMVPAAQGIIASYSTLTNRYTHTAQLLSPPYEAVYQSNSWGDPWTTQYTSVSQQMDDIIYINDIVILQSQSNSGSQQSRPQAWAKNIVSVGGLYHSNDQNDANDSWSGGASIGPAADDRIKPDLACYYDAIWTSDADPGGYASGTHYSNFGGTSAATPITAGAFGLFYEMWHNGIFGNTPGATVFASRPHSTLARAMIINSARQWSFTGTTHDRTRTHQGWGKPDLQKLYDNRNQIFWINESDLLRDLEHKTYNLDVPAGAPELVATLVYIDRAGTTSSTMHRINDLSLKVTAPGGTAYWGNNGLRAGNYSTAGGTSNVKDVVENVIVQNPTPGTWIVEVYADDVNQDTHPENGVSPPDVDYALVVRPATGGGGGCQNINTIGITGPSVGGVGGTVTYNYSSAAASSPFWFLYSLTLGGSMINGQCFDIGPTVLVAGTGTTSATGSGSWTSPPIPPKGAGRTAYVEMRVDGPSGTRDSNALTLTIL